MEGRVGKRTTTSSEMAWPAHAPTNEESKAAAGAKRAAALPDGAVFQGVSHDAGKNAVVTLYSNRIERVKGRGALSVSSARQDTEVTPLKSVTSVQASKEGWRTKVTVYAVGNNIEFRFDHDEAQRFKDALLELIL